jgi:hypothetical protein
VREIRGISVRRRKIAIFIVLSEVFWCYGAAGFVKLNERMETSDFEGGRDFPLFLVVNKGIPNRESLACLFDFAYPGVSLRGRH